jgi:hypothetical protein
MIVVLPKLSVRIVEPSDPMVLPKESLRYVVELEPDVHVVLPKESARQLVWAWTLVHANRVIASTSLFIVLPPRRVCVRAR